MTVDLLDGRTMKFEGARLVSSGDWLHIIGANGQYLAGYVSAAVKRTDDPMDFFSTFGDFPF